MGGGFQLHGLVAFDYLETVPQFSGGKGRGGKRGGGEGPFSKKRVVFI